MFGQELPIIDLHCKIKNYVIFVKMVGENPYSRIFYAVINL